MPNCKFAGIAGHTKSILVRTSLAILAFLLLGLSAGAARAQPYTLTTGIGDGSVTVGVDGYGMWGVFPGPNSTGATFDPIGPALPIVSGWEVGIALRIGAAGPRAFLGSGLINGSGGLPKIIVVGTPTSGTSSFINGGLSFNLVQTIAPQLFNGVQVGSIMTQSYTITNTTAGALNFEMVRFYDDPPIIDGGGRFFDANGIEYLYLVDQIQPLLVGVAAIGGTPLAASRFQVDDRVALLANISGGNPLSDKVVGDINADGIVDPPLYNVTLGLRNAFTLAPGATTVYVAHTIWGTGTPATVLQVPGSSPSPNPGQGEGTYVGSKGPGGGEGSFGFGGGGQALGVLRLRLPVLRGPIPAGQGKSTVLNVSFAQAAADGQDGPAATTRSLLGWLTISLVVGGVAVFFVRRVYAA